MVNFYKYLIFLFIYEGDDDIEERKAFIWDIHRATLDVRFNSFVKALSEAMSPDILENIKKLLQGNRSKILFQ